MNERFDREKWQIVDWRSPNLGERYICPGVNEVHEAQGGHFESAVRAIVRPRPRDLAWLLEQAPKNPGRVYPMTDGFEYQWEPGDGLQYRCKGGEWCNMGIITDTLAATFAEAEPTPGGHDWLRSLEDGAEVVHETNHRLCFYKKDRDYLAAYDVAGTFVHRQTIESHSKSGWRRREKPTPGSREAVVASAPGTCFWCGGPEDKFRDQYYRRRAGDDRLDVVDTLTGQVLRNEGAFVPHWSPVLDQHGNPAEPVVHSQLWAQICCRELGREVASKWGERYRWNKARGRFEFLRSNGEWQDLGDSGNLLNIESPKACQSGWSLYVAPDPLLADTIALLERVRERIGKVGA